MHLKCKWTESLVLSYKIQGIGQEDDRKKCQHPRRDVVDEHHPAKLPLTRFDALWLVLANLEKIGCMDLKSASVLFSCKLAFSN